MCVYVVYIDEGFTVAGSVLDMRGEGLADKKVNMFYIMCYIA